MSQSKIFPLSPEFSTRDPSVSTIDNTFKNVCSDSCSQVTIPSTYTSSSSSVYSDDENLPPLIRKKGLSGKMTFLNFLKGMIGPGCLSLPLALRDAGLWSGLFLIFFFGFLNNFCMLQLVRCSQYLSRKKGDAHLDYGSVAYEAVGNSFKFLRPHKKLAKFIVNFVIAALQVGICSVFYVFVGVHTEEIIEQYFNLGLSKQTYMFIVLLPFILINFLRTLKIIAVISIIGNIMMVASLVFIFQHLIRQDHLMNSLPWLTDFNGIMTATGSVLYSFEGQAMVLPMENKLKNSAQMVGPFGILSSGMSTVTVIYAACGFLGYITYGTDVKGSITLNLPDEPVFTVVKTFLVFVVFFGFVIQQYVIIDLTWPTLKSTIRQKCFKKGLSRMKSLFFEMIYRSILVIVAMTFAIAVPNLEQIIPLVGVTCGMALAFVFPASLDTITFLPGMYKKLRKCEESERMKIKIKIIWRIVQNSLLVLLGVFGMIAGLQSSLRDLISN